MEEVLTLQFDGGSRGNPGPAGIGVVISAADGTPLVTLGRFIGRATNNVAEYTALITALEQARKLGAKKIIVRGDSELVIRQMRGEYRVKNPDMKTLHARASALVGEFAEAQIEHNLRHKNELADKLANLAMDRKVDVTEVNGAEVDSLSQGEADVSNETGDEVSCPRCGCSMEVTKPSSLRAHQLKPFKCQCGAAMQKKDR